MEGSFNNQHLCYFIPKNYLGQGLIAQFTVRPPRVWSSKKIEARLHDESMQLRLVCGGPFTLVELQTMSPTVKTFFKPSNQTSLNLFPYIASAVNHESLAHYFNHNQLCLLLTP